MRRRGGRGYVGPRGYLPPPPVTSTYRTVCNQAESAPCTIDRAFRNWSSARLRLPIRRYREGVQRRTLRVRTCRIPFCGSPEPGPAANYDESPSETDVMVRLHRAFGSPAHAAAAGNRGTVPTGAVCPQRGLPRPQCDKRPSRPGGGSSRRLKSCGPSSTTAPRSRANEIIRHRCY